MGVVIAILVATLWGLIYLSTSNQSGGSNGMGNANNNNNKPERCFHPVLDRVQYPSSVDNHIYKSHLESLKCRGGFHIFTDIFRGYSCGRCHTHICNDPQCIICPGERVPLGRRVLRDLGDI